MAKNRNLKYQFKNVIDRHFVEGMDKHSIKKNRDMDGERIFSYSDRKNLIDLSCSFANYMKKVHPSIKMVKDIRPSHVQDFFNSRVECSQQTLQQYKSRFCKLERLVNSTYHSAVDFHSIVVPASQKNGGGKIRNYMMQNSDYEKMLLTTNRNLKKALILSKEFGLRCSECSKLRYEDIKENGIQIVDSKGKRSRFIPCENKQQQESLKLFRQEELVGRVCPLQTESLQQAFNREAKRQGIAIENGAFHTLRKNYATNKYLEYRQKGLSIKEALKRVSINLGHGANRNKLMQQYICCAIE